MSFEISPRICSHVNEKKKNIKKNEIFKNKCAGDMVDRYLSTKFGVNPLDGLGERGFKGWTNGRTYDGNSPDSINSLVQ